MNLDTLASMAGQSVDIRQLNELNKALRANMIKATTGYPGTGVDRDVGFTGDFAPLVPQSIQSTLDSASYTEKHIQFWNSLSKVPVSSTLHESTRVNEYGSMDVDPWIAEGGTAPNSDSEYERLVVEIKYLAENREISDVATMVGAIGSQGVSRQGLAQQTMDGTRALLGKLERSLFTADSDLTSLAYDGLYKQITGAGYNAGACTYTRAAQRTDLAGASVTVQDLIEKVYEVGAAPNFGMINTVMVEPRVYSGLVNLATAYGRFQQNAAGGNLLFGTNGLSIVGPAGNIAIKSTPLLLPRVNINTAAQGDTALVPDIAILTANNQALITPTTPTLAATGAATGPGFTAAEATDGYTYSLVAVNDHGCSAPIHVAAEQTPAAGDVVQFVINETNMVRAPRYWRVFRSGMGTGTAGTATNVEYLGAWPGSSAAGGAAGSITIIDDNSKRTGTAPIYLIQQDPSVMYWAQLLDFLRRPLAQAATTVPFMLMLFGALHVKVPTKCHVIDNASLTLS